MNETTPKNSIVAAGGKTPPALAWQLVENRLARIDEGVDAAFKLAAEGPDGGSIRFVVRALEDSLARLKAEIQMARNSAAAVAS